MNSTFRAFRGFWQAKFRDAGLVLASNEFSIPTAPKTMLGVTGAT